MSEFLAHWNAPIFILGGIAVLAMLAWPMGSVPVAPKRRPSRIDTYFRSSLERSAPRAEANQASTTPGGHRREIDPARSTLDSIDSVLRRNHAHYPAHHARPTEMDIYRVGLRVPVER